MSEKVEDNTIVTRLPSPVRLLHIPIKTTVPLLKGGIIFFSTH